MKHPNSPVGKRKPKGKSAYPEHCARCDDSRLVPHPDPDKAEFRNIPCPDCSNITLAICKRYLAKPTACPWCGGAIQANSPLDVDVGTGVQNINCTECNRKWCDVYRLADMRPA